MATRIRSGSGRRGGKQDAERRAATLPPRVGEDEGGVASGSNAEQAPEYAEPRVSLVSTSLERTELATPSTERHARIAEAAYRRAEQRGFAPGYELEDWLAAEREVDASGPTQQLRPEDQFTG